jgi:hypothetical protein
MQDLLPQPKLKPGNLIRTKKSPHSFDQPDGSGYFYCFCEQDQMSHSISHGSVGIVINMSRVSSIGNKIVDILFNGSEKIVSIGYYDDQYGNPLWCDIIQ